MGWSGIRSCLVLCGLLASGCAREEKPGPSPVPVPRSSAPAQTTAAPAANYVTAAGSIDLFVIRSSELALERSSARRVREFAAAEIAAHKGTSAQLSLAGRRLNLLPAATLRPSEQQLLDELTESTNFDAAYVRQQRLVHQEALALDKAYAAMGQSATLRPVAGAAVHILQQHLAMLATL